MADYASTNSGLTWKPRTGSLALGVPFVTTGPRLHVASGGVEMVGTLDLNGGRWDEFNGGSGSVGTVNDRTLYFSLLFQALNPSDTQNNQRLFELRESGSGRFHVGQGWSSPEFEAGTRLGVPLDGDVHLVVVKIEYRSGNDRVRVYWDPDPSEDEPASATRTMTRDMRFNEIMYKAQRVDPNGFYVDEVRFGTTWEDVTPVPVITHELNTFAGAGGSLFVDSARTTFNDGEIVYLEAIGDWGFRFDRWEGDVPAGKENDSRIEVTMDQSRTLTAVFLPGKANFFNLEPTDDPFDASPIDLRALNEEVAGQNGFVTRSGDKYLLGDGTRTRFWGVTADAIPDPDLAELAKFLAKRGVNMARWHTSIYDNDAESLSDVDLEKIDDLQRMVTRMKAEGIYTKASFFFVLGLRIKAAWEIDGYDASWISANSPGFAEEAPFGLVFFDEKLKAAYKHWVTVLFTTPNPYNDGVPLKDDPALAIIEAQNEDNLFFWTFKPQRYPEAQQHKLDGRFGDWLSEKYGSLADAQSAWGAVSGSLTSRDDVGAGRVTVNEAWFMTSAYNGSAGDRARLSDQIQFLLDLQRGWYEEMVDHMRSTVGCRQLFTASNWVTADNAFLQDGEYYTYAAADITDTHNYFAPRIVDQAIFTQISGGDEFFGIPAVNNPRAFPLAIKQTEGHPSMISESTWVNPSSFKAEAALMTAAYGSLNDIDTFFWFATRKKGWQNGLRTWEFATPLVGGMFPGAALLYRRGDVTEAPVVVREGRTPGSIGDKEPSVLIETRGWDPTRDPDQEFDYDPNTGAGSVDSLATFVGKAEIAFDGDADFVHPDVENHIDYSNGLVRSITGELELHWGKIKGANPADPQEGKGRFTVDTSRAQGASGWLRDAGMVSLQNVDISMNNEWGSVLVVSLDGAPLANSRQILIQAATKETPRRWETTPKVLNDGTADYLGEEIVNLGDLPWQIEGVDVAVNLKDTGNIVAIEALDENGYAIANLTVSNPFELPSQALYTVVTLSGTPGSNLDPTAVSDLATLAEDTDVVIDVLANDTDPDGDSLSLGRIASQPGSGVAEIVEGKIRYAPSANFHGNDSLTYEVSDGNGGLGIGSVSVVVTPVNDLPVATADTSETPEDTAVSISVLENDTDPDGDSLDVARLVSTPSHGTATVQGSIILYTPSADFNGDDRFTYEANDGNGGSHQAEVTVSISSVPDRPVAVEDFGRTDEDTAAVFDVLANDVDVDEESLTIARIVTNPATGNASIAANKIEFVPEADFHGSVQLAYEVSDPGGLLAQATLSIVVDPVNDVPVAGDDVLVTDEDTAATVNVLANDTDVDGDTIAIIGLVESPANGEATIAGSSIEYVPNQDFHGSDLFRYRVSDGKVSSEATVTATVTPVNDPPLAVADSVTTDEDTPIAIAVLSNDRDPDGDSLSVVGIAAGAGSGNAVIDGERIAYTPDLDFHGSDTFSYRIGDGSGAETTSTVTVTIRPVNDPPVALDDRADARSGQPVSIDVLANDTDVDGDALSLVRVSLEPTGGSAEIIANAIIYTATPEFFGTDTLRYQVGDGQGAFAQAELSLDVALVRAPQPTIETISLVKETRAVQIIFRLDGESGGFEFKLQKSSVLEPDFWLVVPGAVLERVGDQRFSLTTFVPENEPEIYVRVMVIRAGR